MDLNKELPFYIANRNKHLMKGQRGNGIDIAIVTIKIKLEF